MTGRVRSAAHSAVLIKSGSRTLKPSAQPPERVSVVGLLTVGFSRKRPPAPSVCPHSPRARPCATVRQGLAPVRQSFAVSLPAVDTKRSAALSLARGPDDLRAYHRGPQDVSDLHFERHAMVASVGSQLDGRLSLLPAGRRRQRENTGRRRP